MEQTAILRSITEGDALPGYERAILKALETSPKSIVVLDDDPTGTQTIYDIPVITEWTQEILERELVDNRIFFILTNSRSLQAEEANSLAECIGQRLKIAADKLDKSVLVISRSDSTLRGHYPNEVEALVKGLGWKNTKQLLIPAFFEGGRYTFNDVHYVAEKQHFVPASKTPFAQDNTFGYSSSNLKEYILEKYGPRISPDEIGSISLTDLRASDLTKVQKALTSKTKTHFVVNATSYSDLQAIALSCLLHQGHLVFRSAASFVNALGGIAPKKCLEKGEILKNKVSYGALTVVGSYVPKTTAQLNYLKNRSSALFLELNANLVFDINAFSAQISDLAEQADKAIDKGQNVVIYTSRTIVKGADKKESLAIVNEVANGLNSLIRQLRVRPRYILAKGGITSSDIATKGLGVKRAMVLGQVIKGVPVWQLGNESKFPNLPYIVFPGNVGDEKAVAEVIELLN
ncbi:four-carbon acid sugar kinase family protein [Zobellia galactanivorans]|uniref:Hydroxyacid dehydrogenase n=1 Tax=Zobellia galactanivorans (strain DSM 12802 / CCUG 47099 / CIP 106680 / NCIMB 13871 / Dsij) TaxID=63186 RepID=G0L844_ZOBGA|nr:four-carbon acid sugar kinase family protein [Zobellia galactanivorans]CAZ97934.1 Conserved hypothetical protein [Zobellia galactanivorans]